MPPADPPEHPFRFTPVPRRDDRAGGWSSDRQHAFVWALAKMPLVAVAARSVGMSARSAYKLRQAPGAEAFARAWDLALEMGLDATLDTSLKRAIDGQVRPIYRRGRVVGTCHSYDNRLAMRALAVADRQMALVA